MVLDHKDSYLGFQEENMAYKSLSKRLMKKEWKGNQMDAPTIKASMDPFSIQEEMEKG